MSTRRTENAPRRPSEAALTAESLPPGTFPTDAQFQERWDRLGGLTQNGYALSPVFSEIAEDGKSYDVQYFERAKFELHPAEPDPEYKIMLSRLGVNEWKRTYPGRAVDATTPIDPKFTEYWNTHGGLYQQGLPLGPAETLMAEDGKPYYTQFFERSVFEYHPENLGKPGGYEVELKRVGANELKSRYPSGFPSAENPNALFPKEFGDRDGYTKVFNHGVTKGIINNPDISDTTHNIQAMSDAYRRIHLGTTDKFEFHIYETAREVQDLIAKAEATGYKLAYDPKVDWANDYGSAKIPGATPSYIFGIPGANSVWQWHGSLSDGISADQKNKYNVGFLGLMMGNMEIKNTDSLWSDAWGQEMQRQVLDPYYKTGKMNFSLKVILP